MFGPMKTVLLLSAMLFVALGCGCPPAEKPAVEVAPAEPPPPPRVVEPPPPPAPEQAASPVPASGKDKKIKDKENKKNDFGQARSQDAKEKQKSKCNQRCCKSKEKIDH